MKTEQAKGLISKLLCLQSWMTETSQDAEGAEEILDKIFNNEDIPEQEMSELDSDIWLLRDKVVDLLNEIMEKGVPTTDYDDNIDILFNRIDEEKANEN